METKKNVITIGRYNIGPEKKARVFLNGTLVGFMRRFYNDKYNSRFGLTYKISDWYFLPLDNRKPIYFPAVMGSKHRDHKLIEYLNNV